MSSSLLRVVAPLLVVQALFATGALAANKRVLVLDLRNDGVPETTTRLVRDALTAQLAQAPGFTVVSTEDLRRSATLEAEKQAAGCEVDESCLAEIAEALGADLVVHGSIGPLGSVTVVNLSLFDPSRATAAARDSFSVERPELLPARLRVSVDKLVGTGAGGPSALLVTGGVLTGAGVLVALGLGSAAAWGSVTIADPAAAGRDKQLALDVGPAAVVGASVAVLVAGVGAALMLVDAIGGEP